MPAEPHFSAPTPERSGSPPAAPAGRLRRPPGRRPWMIAAVAVLLAAAGVTATLVAGDRGPAVTAARAQALAGPSRAADGARVRASAAPGGEVEQVDPLAPLPRSRAKAVSPVAGASLAAVERKRAAAASAGDDMSLPTPKRAANRTSRPQTRAPDVGGLRVDRATALPNGVALPPLEAPESVLQVIRAGNTIARAPYKWGGGHGSFKDNGYDCSGSVTYALFAAGLIEGSRTSGQLESWGEPGKGRWITVYANAGHTFMEVAGIRFDTSGARRTGSRWQNGLRPVSGYVVRHPPGL